MRALNLVISHPKSALIPSIRYSFRFTSLVAPTTKAFDATLPRNLNSDLLPKRVLVKRSYAVLAWISYLTRFGTNTSKNFRPNIAILPARTKLYTLTKAPMAHKTNSKEQFLFKFYNFKFSFNLSPLEPLVPSSIRQGAYVLLLTRRLFPVFETNLLALKYYEISHPVKLTSYLSSIE